MKKILANAIGLIVVFTIVIGSLIVKNIYTINSITQSLNSITSSQPDQIIFDLNKLNIFISTIEKTSNNKFFPLLLPKEMKEFFKTLKQILPDIKLILSLLTKNEQNWVIIFQNSNELRATGGFMGSYSIVEINQGKINSINTEDIYDADGQFAGFIDAPTGVNEYLSNGKGLRLPDANWHADTVMSAEQILPFFALGNKKNIKGIIFVNLNFAKQLLDFLGPIEISDYNTIVTENNVDTVLRSRRDDFFPGSTQKKHILSQLITQIRIKITQLDSKKLVALINLIGNEISKHDLQFYSNIEEIDQIFAKYKMRQTLELMENTDYIYLVESNVGINKANKNIDREVTLKKSESGLDIQVEFFNNNVQPNLSKLSEISNLLPTQISSKEAEVANHLAYINYQRVIVPENWELSKIKYNQIEIKEVDTNIIEINNHKFKQIGFLITLGENKSASLNLSFNTKKVNDSIFIQLQPGLPATKYILEYNQDSEEYLLTKNQIINYQRK